MESGHSDRMRKPIKKDIILERRNPMKIVGYRKSDFTTKDGTFISGYNIFTEEVIADGGVGVQTDKYYLSDAKIKSFGLDLDQLVGKEVLISYNRWGKISGIFQR